MLLQVYSYLLPVVYYMCTPAGFPTICSKVVPQLHFFFVCASVVSYLTFGLSLYFPHLSFFWCLGRAMLRDYGFSWISSQQMTCIWTVNSTTDLTVHWTRIWPGQAFFTNCMWAQQRKIRLRRYAIWSESSLVTWIFSYLKVVLRKLVSLRECSFNYRSK